MLLQQGLQSNVAWAIGAPAFACLQLVCRCPSLLLLLSVLFAASEAAATALPLHC